MGKYPVTNLQFARFIASGGYDRPEYWSEAGWAWRTGTYDSKAPKELWDWLSERSMDTHDRPYWWDDRQWNSPLFPVVGITWFEAEGYARWLSEQLRNAGTGEDAQEIREGLVAGRLMVRLPTEAEWEAAIGSRGAYPWGTSFDQTRLNCAESWAERRLSDGQWIEWLTSDTQSRREAGTTAVTTYPRGASKVGVWDNSGNVWEWMTNTYEPGGNEMALRGGAWDSDRGNALVSSSTHSRPVIFNLGIGVRVVVGPVLKLHPVS
jgi:formylglycine-generating enzyme required for sulfatase activity